MNRGIERYFKGQSCSNIPVLADQFFIFVSCIQDATTLQCVLSRNPVFKIVFSALRKKMACNCDHLGLGWWWTWWRRIAAIGGLRRLKLDTALLTVVTLIVSVVVVYSSVIRRRRLVGVVWLRVVLVGVLGVVVVERTSGPASTIERPTSCLAAATCCDATARVLDCVCGADTGVG